jgi:hypothetical protein
LTIQVSRQSRSAVSASWGASGPHPHIRQIRVFGANDFEPFFGSFAETSQFLAESVDDGEANRWEIVLVRYSEDLGIVIRYIIRTQPFKGVVVQML